VIPVLTFTLPRLPMMSEDYETGWFHFVFMDRASSGDSHFVSSGPTPSLLAECVISVTAVVILFYFAFPKMNVHARASSVPHNSPH
jgi:hypothetical protein